MRLDQPRVTPLEADQWDEKAQEVMAQFVAAGSVFNIFKTMAHHPDLLRRWLVFGNHVLGKSTLPERDREILILRVGHLCDSAYEWGQHVVFGRAAGLSDGEIRRIRVGGTDPAWSETERALLDATDELHADSFVGDATWATLAEHYTVQQLLDIVFTVGQYTMVSMALNTLGVQLDEGLPGWDV